MLAKGRFVLLSLAAAALVARPASAGGWQEMHETSDDVRLDVGPDGVATVQHHLRYRVVAVTDRQIHVYAAKLWRVCDPGRRLSSHPLGAMVARPPQPLNPAREIYIGDRRLWVQPAFKRELADGLFAAAGGSTAIGRGL